MISWKNNLTLKDLNCFIALSFLSFPERGTQWAFVDMEQLNKLLAVVQCPRCQETECLRLETNEAKRCGFALLLTLSCASCGVDFSSEYSSPRVATETSATKPFAIIDILVAFFNQVGLGHTAMRLLGALLGTKVLHLKTFQAKEERIINTITDATDDVLQRSASAVHAAHGVTDGVSLDVTVSFDGSWQKWGHTSLYGFGAVVEVLAGLILDYIVVSKYCHTCAMKSSQYGVSKGHSSRDLPISVNHFPISVNHFPISVNHFPISEMNNRYR